MTGINMKKRRTQISAEDAQNLKLLSDQLDIAAQDVQAKNGEILVPEIPEIEALTAKGTNTTAVENAISSTLSTLEILGVDIASANSAYFDYLTANAETKAMALNTAVETINTTIDTAIAQQAAMGGDTTALNTVKAQLDSALSGAGQGQTVSPVQASPAATSQTMTYAISALMSLPANLQTQTKVEAARQAYFDYLTASPEGKAAAYDNAVKLLRESAKAALENPSLDAGTRAELEGLLGEMGIDSGNSTATMVKSNEKIARKAETAGIIKEELEACIEFYERANGQFKDIDTTVQAFKHLTNGEFDEFAEMVDVSSPYNKAFCWSGDQAAAETQASADGGMTLEMTPGGSLVNDWDWLKSKFSTWEDGLPTDLYPLWKALSRRYALGIRGIVTYVHPKGYYGKIWIEVERPILINNGVKIVERWY
jgi:hypothetical protein